MRASAHLPRSPTGLAAAARRRGGRLPRRARLRHPLYLRAAAHRDRPGGGERNDRPPHAGRACARRAGALLERGADAPASSRAGRHEQAADARRGRGVASLPAGAGPWPHGTRRRAPCRARHGRPVRPAPEPWRRGRVPRRAASIPARRTTSLPLFMKTWNAKPGEVERRWYLVDAEGKTLGRLATQIADTLRGKGKPQYTPHVDTGDFVVVVNAEKIHVTGKKLDDKMYHRHSGYPGGLKSRPLRDELERRPTEVLRKAVKGMLPRNRLARAQMRKLKIYAGPAHPHEAQSPQELELTT